MGNSPKKKEKGKLHLGTAQNANPKKSSVQAVPANRLPLIPEVVSSGILHDTDARKALVEQTSSGATAAQAQCAASAHTTSVSFEPLLLVDNFVTCDLNALENHLRGAKYIGLLFDLGLASFDLFSAEREAHKMNPEHRFEVWRVPVRSKQTKKVETSWILVKVCSCDYLSSNQDDFTRFCNHILQCASLVLTLVGDVLDTETFDVCGRLLQSIRNNRSSQSVDIFGICSNPSASFQRVMQPLDMFRWGFVKASPENARQVVCSFLATAKTNAHQFNATNMSTFDFEACQRSENHLRGPDFKVVKETDIINDKDTLEFVYEEGTTDRRIHRSAPSGD